MLQNYLILAIRLLWKNKVLASINIFGLAIGLAASILILIYTQFELSYDQQNENLDRMYRITIQAALGGNEIAATTSPYPMAAALRNEFPEVETAARFRQFFQETLVSFGELRYQESEVFHVDQQFLDIFTVNFLAGDPGSALEEPYSVVLTNTVAEKYFGSQEAIGQLLRFNNNQDYAVTGVIEDFPANSHIHPEILVSFTSDSDHDSQFWVSNNIHTYLLVHDGTNVENLEENLQSLVTKYVAPQITEGIGVSFDEFIAGGGAWAYLLFPVTDVHLYSNLDGEIEPPSSAIYVYTFQAVAVFILLLACINYTNLTTARSVNRAKEIGIRKVMGAHKSLLAGQFLLESATTCLLALCLAIPLVAMCLPALNAITDRQLDSSFLFSITTLAQLFAGTVAVSIIAGSYPVFYLAKFQPQVVLKGSLARGGGNSWIRGGLVVLQFSISIALIAATFIVFNQLEYVRNKELGFNKEQLVVIERAGTLGDQLEAYKNQIAQNSNVISVTSSSHLPGDGGDQNAFMIEGRPTSESEVLHRFTVNYDYIETLGINLAQGRSFDRAQSGEHPGFLINETAVRELGLDDPLSTVLMEPDSDGMISGPVIGVINDFHFLSLHQPINSMVLRIGDFTRYIVVRVANGETDNLIRSMEDLWISMTNNEPFSYTFLGDEFDSLHEGEEKVGELFFGFSLLAIFIACLGLYGLASFATAQRTKEIGVRKVMGASISDIVLLVGKEFLILVAIAFLFAAPAAYFAMSRWLEVFAYRIDIGMEAFLLSGIMAMFVSFLTVGYQAFLSASKNPTLAIRDE